MKRKLPKETSLQREEENNYQPFYGGVAQLGEHLPCKQGVMGSNPIISTKAKLSFAQMFIENRIKSKRNETDSCKRVKLRSLTSRKTCYLLLSIGFSVQKKWEQFRHCI